MCHHVWVHMRSYEIQSDLLEIFLSCSRWMVIKQVGDSEVNVEEYECEGGNLEANGNHGDVYIDVDNGDLDNQSTAPGTTSAVMQGDSIYVEEGI